MGTRLSTRHLGTRGWLRLVVAAALVLVLVLTLEASPAAGASRTACRVRNTDSGRGYKALQAAVDAAKPGAHLVVTGTCVGTTVIDKDLVIEGIRIEHSGKPTLSGTEGVPLVAVESGVAVQLRSLVIRDGQAPEGAAILNRGTLVLRDVVVRDNYPSGTGGAVNNEGTLSLYGASSIRDNSDYAAGGAAVKNDGALTLNDSSSIKGNYAAAFDEGGGGVLNRGTLTLNDASSIRDNDAAFGVGVYVDPGATLTLNDSSSIRDNYGSQDPGGGGGVTVAGGTVTLNDSSSISDNQAQDGGGGVRVEGGGSVILNGSSSIGGNTAPDGGGVFVADGTLTLNDSASISGNEAWEAGGGVYDSGGTLTGVTCGSAAGANVHGNTPEDCYVFGEPRRIERPDDGVALTFPVGWDIEITNDWRTAETGPGAAKFREILVGRRAPDHDEYCAVLDLARMAEVPPGWASLDDAISWASDWAANQETVVDQRVSLALPAGEVASVDIHYDDGWEMTDFAFADSGRWFLLQCGADDPPTDRWLSIAESFEFLPAPAVEAPPAEVVRATGRFTSVGSLAEARWYHTATLLRDGRVLVVGGYGEADQTGAYVPDPPLSSAEIWDPETGTFTPTGSMAGARVAHTATLLRDGRVLIVGGGGAGEDAPPLASTEVWDPLTGEFTPTGSPAEGRAGHTATLLPRGRVLVVGGDGGYENTLASAEVWDPATGEFAPAGMLAKARSLHTATLLPDGRVLVIGGTDWWDLATLRRLAEVWDPAINEFAPAGTMTEARMYHTATLLPDGQVAVQGGLGETSLPTDVLVWDPARDRFVPAGSLAEGRANHTATLLPDGRVLVIGGGLMTMGAAMAGESYLLASAEVWEPVTEESSPAGTLDGTRGFHTATLLPDGRVLVVGGAGEAGKIAQAEVWGPSMPSTSE